MLNNFFELNLKHQYAFFYIYIQYLNANAVYLYFVKSYCILDTVS